MNKQLVHLHVHSEFSVLDGLGSVDEYVQRAVQLGQPALALTDHGVLCGAPLFYHTARKAELEPVLGCEFYFVNDARWRPPKGSKEQPERFHVGILARGARGYEVLSELSTASHRNFYHKPLLDMALLESLGDDAQHLVCLSGCAASLISKTLLEDGREAAGAELSWWREIFPHFYVELMHHDTTFDEELNDGLIDLARAYKVPLVVTNDPHYVTPKDCEHHDALLAIQTASDIDDPSRFRFDGDGYHLRSRAEMRSKFRRYGHAVWAEGVANTLAIAADCHTRIPQWEKRTWHIPKYPDADDAFDALKRLALAELKRRGWHKDIRYFQQFATELKVIKEVGIADFLMITWWIINRAKELGIPVGPGRGSVCGCLVAYLIGLHKIDPIRYDLRFERFLNPARPRMPDIDTDLGQARRKEMFDEIDKKFGVENVVHVCTYGHMRYKSAFQSLAKAYGINYTDAIRISKKMSNQPEEGQDILPEEVREQYPDLTARLERLNGVKRQIAPHPAGVIIADPSYNLRKIVPEMWLASGKTMCGQYDLEAVEDMGLMKEDLLGLRTLDTIAECVRLISERHDVDLDPDEWVPDEEQGDAEVYAMLAQGFTAGVFQMEGDTNTRGIQEVNCQNFEDIVSTTALYRTGPIAAGYPEQFKNNRIAGKRHIKYAHPLLKPILERTWGVILYQEQVMDIGSHLAGFDMVQVDDIKEAIKHKKSALMESMRPVFIEGCKRTNGVAESVSTAIWKDIEGYSGYCLSGDTVVQRASQNNHQPANITLADLWERWHHGPLHARKAYRRRGLSLRAFVDGRIKKAKCIGIERNGVKPVYRIVLEDGQTLKATSNHRHMTTEGWTRTDQLMPGVTKVMIDTEIQDHRQQYRNGWLGEGHGRGWYKERTAARAVAFDGANRPVLHGYSTAMRKTTTLLPDYCELCGATKEDGAILDRAHLDQDRTNNSRENLLRLCRRCHKNHDAPYAVGSWERGTLVAYSKVVSVEYAGEEMTYDVIMEDDGHNFVANGIVTHNSYNRSHAVAYSFTTYQTARLKWLYPLEFITALLRTVEDDDDKRQAYMQEAVRLKLRIAAPDINLSDIKAVAEGEDTIRLGFSDIKGIGVKMGQRILDGKPARRYRRVATVAAAINNEGKMPLLYQAGALASITTSKVDSDMQEQLLGWSFDDRMVDLRAEYADDIVMPDADGEDEWCCVAGEVTKLTRGQTKNGKPFATWEIRWSPTHRFKVRLWAETEALWTLPRGTVVMVRGTYDKQWGNISVGNPKMIKVLRKVRTP